MYKAAVISVTQLPGLSLADMMTEQRTVQPQLMLQHHATLPCNQNITPVITNSHRYLQRVFCCSLCCAVSCLRFVWSVGNGGTPVISVDATIAILLFIVDPPRGRSEAHHHNAVMCHTVFIVSFMIFALLFGYLGHGRQIQCGVLIWSMEHLHPHWFLHQLSNPSFWLSLQLSRQCHNLITDSLSIRFSLVCLSTSSRVMLYSTNFCYSPSTNIFSLYGLFSWGNSHWQ